MKDSTKHLIAKEIAYIVPLFLLGFAILSVMCIIAGENPFEALFSEEWYTPFFLSCIPLFIGYSIRLYKWVVKWK